MHASSRSRRLALAAGPPLIVAALLAVPSPARCEARWGFAGFAGYSHYSMGDVNQAIELVNSLLGGGPQLDYVNDGVTYGLGARVYTTDNMRFSLDYERLTAGTSIEDPTGSIELDLPADAFTATATYFIPSQGRARLGFGGGLGYYVSAGSETDEVVGVGSVSSDWEGSGVGFQLLAQGDVALSRTLKLELAAGYRMAAVDLEVDGVDTQAEIDWSGFASRIGLAFYP